MRESCPVHCPRLPTAGNRRLLTADGGEGRSPRCCEPYPDAVPQAGCECGEAAGGSIGRQSTAVDCNWNHSWIHPIARQYQSRKAWNGHLSGLKGEHRRAFPLKNTARSCAPPIPPGRISAEFVNRGASNTAASSARFRIRQTQRPPSHQALPGESSQATQEFFEGVLACIFA